MKRILQTIVISSLFILFNSICLAGIFDDEPVNLINANDNGLSVELNLPEYKAENEIMAGQNYTKISIDHWGSTGEFGKPDLPVFSKMIALPNSGGLEYNVHILETEILKNVTVSPLQKFSSDNPSVQEEGFYIDDQYYDGNSSYPEHNFKVADPVIMRDMRMAQITFAPFRYNPSTRELTIVKKMRVDIQFNNNADVNQKNGPVNKIGSSFNQLYASSAINYDQMFADRVEERGGYIFVVTNDSYANQIQPLVEWKKEKGFPVNVVKTSVIGSSKENIKSYIQNAYFNWEIPPEFVVLVGDEDGSIAIATDHFDNGWFDNSLTDHYYAKLEGDDYFPDILVGRLSVRSSTELATVINKIMGYEAQPPALTDWTDRALMIADYGSMSCKFTKQFVKSRCMANGYSQVDEVYFGSSAPTTTITNSINNGVGIVNFRGYLGWGGWGSDDIYNLSNIWMTPIVFGGTCETGSFEITTCISEAWLRAGTPGQPKGGIGCVGPSSWNTHTKYNNVLDSGFGVGLLDDDLEYYMAVINRGKLELYNCFPYNHYGHNTNSVESYYHTYNLMGDPGLSVWTDTPEMLTVEMPEDIPIGTNYYPVYVEDESGQPVEGAYVNLWKGDEIYVGGFTDNDGEINLPIETVTSGVMKVCITGQNLYPLRQNVNITDGELFLGIIALDIDDDNVGSSSGNSDGIFNPGETIELDVRIENFGSQNVNGVTGEITLDNNWVNITINTASFGNLNAGSTAWSNSSYIIEIASDCPHDEYIEISVVIEDVLNQEWNSMIAQTVETADLVARSHDLPGAGANGKLDPGETSDMIVDLENYGTYPSETLTGTISSVSELVTIIDSQGTFNPILPGAQGSNDTDPFELQTPAETYPGSPVDIRLVLSSPGGFTDTTYISMELGVPGDGDPMIPDDYGYYCYDNSDVSYTPAPLYQWVEVSGLTTPLNLPDYGNEQDCSIRVEFPPGFNFTYYGQDFDDITVCSNGWAAFGLTTMCNFRNWPITAAQVAPACLAAFWDDLVLNSGGGTDGKVFAHFDEPNHRFIIEWKNVSNADAGYANECFEIVLYDPTYHLTPTGDGIIDFQYQNVNNSGSEHNATVGIATPDNGDGVQYTFANIYPPGAAELHNFMTIRFTTEGNIEYEPPVIEVEPDALTIEVPENSSASESLTISNTGASILSFNLNAELENEEQAELFGLTQTDDMGGPDIFGYLWIDSDEPGGPDYEWIDITAIGSEITWVHNDSTTEEMPIGFMFPFYEQVFEEFILSANGWLSFTSHANAWSNLELPSSAAPENLVAGFWDDLDPLQPDAEVYSWSNNSDTLIVSYINVPHWGTSTIGTYTYQMILTSAGDIKFQYQSLEGNYESGTVGIQNHNGTDGLNIAYNEEYLHENLAVQIVHPFIRFEPRNGAVSPGLSTDVNIYAYSYGREEGTYNATIYVESNDPVTPLIEVQLTVEIGAGGAVQYELTMEPLNPPIIIPPQGGSFQYQVTLENYAGTMQTFDFWIMAMMPDSSVYGPIFTRPNLNLPPGGNISRLMTQQVPGAAPSGQYYYYANTGVYPDSVTFTEGFIFTKSSGESVPYDFFNWDLFGWDNTAPEVPIQFAFHGAYPNPFNPVTEIHFDLPEQSLVEIRVFDILGREVALLNNGTMPAGSHFKRWDANDLASGVYFIHLKAGKNNATGKMLLLK